jgi:hypothetical protein
MGLGWRAGWREQGKVFGGFSEETEDWKTLDARLEEEAEVGG